VRKIQAEKRRPITGRGKNNELDVSDDLGKKGIEKNRKTVTKEKPSAITGIRSD